MLEIRLKTIFKIGWNGIKFVFDRFEDFSAFGRIDQDKAYAFIIFVDIGVRLLPSPEVCDGDITRTSGIAEVTFAATVTEHDMLIEYVCKVHFSPPHPEFESFTMSLPTEDFLVSKVNPGNGVALLLLQVGKIVAPNIWSRDSMTNYVNQHKVLPEFLAYITVESRCLARSTREKNGKAVFQVLLNHTEDASEVTLHILAATELVTLYLGGGTLVSYTEMVFVASSIYHASLFEDII